MTGLHLTRPRFEGFHQTSVIRAVGVLWLVALVWGAFSGALVGLE